MASLKDILNAALKALLAGAEVSPWIKIPSTFISELAGKAPDKLVALNQANSKEQFEQILTQAELVTYNSAEAVVGTEQIKILVSNLTTLIPEYKKELQEMTQEQYKKRITVIGKQIKFSVDTSGNRNTTNIAGGNISTGIDPKYVLDRLEKKTEENVLLRTETQELKNRVVALEKQLAQPHLISSQQEISQPSKEAKDLAAKIDEDSGPYVSALKAIAEGNNKEANQYLDEVQENWDNEVKNILDQVEKQKDQGQTKIYFARMQNAYYSGKPQEALEWGEKLIPFAKDDTDILNFLGMVYYQNARYHEAESLFKQSLELDEQSFGSHHPNVARDLNNLAQLLQDTNRFAEAEPLMRRALEIDEKSFGSDHPNVAIRLNNLAILLKDTNRLAEAEPMFKRTVGIFEASLGVDHPNSKIVRGNWEICKREMEGKNQLL